MDFGEAGDDDGRVLMRILCSFYAFPLPVRFSAQVLPCPAFPAPVAGSTGRGRESWEVELKLDRSFDYFRFVGFIEQRSGGGRRGGERQSGWWTRGRGAPETEVSLGHPVHKFPNPRVPGTIKRLSPNSNQTEPNSTKLAEETSTNNF